jgi:hypothetical protein
MEDVLDVYHRPYDPARPLVGVDEKPIQLLSEPRPAQLPKPGRPRRQDYEYQREGTANIFCALAPLEGHRRLKVTRRRTARDFARFLAELVEQVYPQADQVVLVLDNLNTHSPACLYEVFPPARARRITEKLEIHYTPKHGSWLNVAEIELSVLGKRLPDRIPSIAALTRHVKAQEKQRNRQGKGVTWQFTTADARIKLQRLYPSVEGC